MANQPSITSPRLIPVGLYERFFDYFEKQQSSLLSEGSTDFGSIHSPEDNLLQRRKVHRQRAINRATMLRNWCSVNPAFPTDFWTPLLENGKAGIGVALFFNFVKDYMIGWLFFCLYAFYALAEYANGEGPSLNDSKYDDLEKNPPDLMQISISNLGTERVSLGLMITDFIFSIMFMAFVYYQKDREHKKIVNLQMNRVSASDYSFQMTGLPKLPYKAAELENFFSVYGSVCNVKIIVDCTNLVDIRREQRDANAALEHAVAAESNRNTKPWYWDYVYKYDEDNQPSRSLYCLQYIGLFRDSKYWGRRIESLDREYGEAIQKPSQPTGRAFITFDSVDATIDCKEVYMKNSIMRACQLIWCYSGPPRFRYRTINISDTPEPQDILWENLGSISFKKFLYKCRSAFVAMVFIIIGTLLVFSILDEDVAISTENCILVAFIIAATNFAINRSLYFLVPHERHYSLTGTQTGLCMKIIFFLLANSLLTIVLAGLISSKDDDRNDDKFDLEYFWKTPEYVEVYSLVMITSSVGPILRRIMLPGVRSLRAKVLDKYCFTEADFDDVYGNPPFDLAEAYAYAFHLMFMALILSPVIPIVLIICFLAFVAHYFVCRYMILRANGPPPPYEMKLALHLERFAPISVALHMLVSCICYTLQGVEYKDSLISAVLNGELKGKIFSSDSDNQDDFLFFYWVVTAVALFANVVVPLTPLRSILQDISFFRREQFVVSEKLAEINPLSFNQAVTSRYFVPYQPPISQEDTPLDKSRKVDEYIEQVDRRLMGDVLWNPAYLGENSETSSIGTPKRSSKRVSLIGK